MFHASVICIMGIGYFVNTIGSCNSNSYSLYMNQALIASDQILWIMDYDRVRLFKHVGDCRVTNKQKRNCSKLWVLIESCKVSSTC